MGVSLEQLGVIKGFGQAAGLILGGLLGGWWIARVGLRKAFWPLVVCMHVPNVLYIWAAYTRPHPPGSIPSSSAKRSVTAWASRDTSST